MLRKGVVLWGSTLPDNREHVLSCSRHFPVENFACNSFYNLVHISVRSKAEYATWIFIQSNRVVNAL